MPYTEFHAALLSFVKSHDRLVVLRSYAGTPDTTDVNDHLAFRYYVRQLRIIDLPDIDVLEAVNDFLRTRLTERKWRGAASLRSRLLTNLSTSWW